MTTPVGSIRLDLKIDGSGLPAEVLREVKTALEPALAELRRDINALQRAYDKLGRDAVQAGEKQAAAAKAAARAVDGVEDQYRQVARAAERSAAEQVAANRRVAASVDEIGDHYTRLSATAFASSRAQVAALHSVTRAIDEQSAAWGRLTAARTVAAASPTPGGPGSGGGGGPGGGGYGGGRSGRVGRWATNPFMLNAAALTVGSFPAAATGIVNLTGAIQQLLQAGGLVPGMVGGIVSSVGTLKLGFAGVGDAFKAVWKAAESGNPKDIKKAAAALEGVAPAAKDAIAAVVGLKGAWESLQRDTVQQNMFAGLDQTITDLANRSMPTLQKGLGGIATAWNGTFKQLGATVGSDRSLSLLDKLFGNTAEAQARANKAIEPWTHAIETLTAESSDFLPRIADGFAALGTRFDTFIGAAVADGRFDRWIDQGIDAATNLGNAFINIGKIINDLTTAAGGDGGFLKWLNESTAKLHEFLSSDEGQDKLTNFFREGKEQLEKWAPILGNIATIAGNVYDGMKQWSDILLPVLKQVTDVLANFPGLTELAVTGFLAFKTLSVFGGLLDGLGKVNTGLGKATASAGGLAGKLGSLAGRAGGILALAGALEALKKGEDLMNPDGHEPPPSAAAALGGGALDIGGGAIVGAQIAGPVGAIVGAGAGAGKAVYDRARGDLNRQSAIADENLARIQKRDAQVPQTVDTNRYGADISAIVDQAEAASNALDALGAKITMLPNADIQIDNPTPEIIQQVLQLGLKVKTLPNGNVVIDANTDVAMNKVAALNIAIKNVIGAAGAIPSSIPVPRYNPSGPAVGGGGALPRSAVGRADGGVLPGYSPGVDNLLVPMSGGEGVLIPEAVRGIGGAAAVYAINSMFRRGISRRGYAAGGIVGFEGGGIIPSGMSPMAADVAAGVAQAIGPLIGLLGEIRDQLRTALPTHDTTPLPESAQASLTGGSSLTGSVDAAALAPDGTWLPIKGTKNNPLTDGDKAVNKQLTDALKPLTAAITETIKRGGYGKLAELGIGPDSPLAQQLAAARNTALAQNAGLLAAAGPVGSQGYNDVLNKNVLSPLASALNRTVKGNAYTGKLADYGIAADDPLISGLLGLRGTLAGTAPSPLPATPGAGMADAMVGMPTDMCGCIGQQVGQEVNGSMGLQAGQSLLGGLASGIQEAAPKIADGVAGGLTRVLGGTSTSKAADPAKLLNAGNLAGIAGAFGYKVGDYSRAGGNTAVTAGDGPKFTADGQMNSDTLALIDRTFSSLNATMNAGFNQLLDVMSQVLDQLVKLGTQLASQASSAAINAASTAAAPAAGKALGGPIWGGVPGRDSVPILAMPGEHMLTVSDVAAMGGHAGVYAFRRALHGAPGFAAGGDVNATIGADFYGVSQVPILGAIVNLLTSVLLGVIGVQIKARDTMTQMTDEFRKFRGAFAEFNASGALLNDTSGLTDRSSSSEQEAADERIRVLKIVIKELIRFIIDDLIVPIAKAVGKAAVNIGASAAGSAVSASSMGGGGPAGAIVSGLISAAGDAGVDIGASVFQTFADSLTGVLTDSITAGIQNMFPGAVQAVFGQGFSGFFPTGTNMLPTISTSTGGGFAGILAALLGGAAGMFDDGGIAIGTGLMAKDTIAPERVLSPRQTTNHERLTELLDAGALKNLGNTRTVTVHAPFTVLGGETVGRDAHNELLRLIDV